MLYVVEQEGQIYRWYRGTRRLFLDVRSTVLLGGEQGLLSLAFDPNYAQNRLFYIYYTNNAGDIRVARFRANASSTRTVAGSRRVLLSVRHPGQTNHNGGQLAFSSTGRLYAGTGDGGGGCDPNGNAQRRSSRLGKLLSLNPRNIGAGWRLDGYGLRNPWRFSFDRATGRLYIADVGQNRWEEIDTRGASQLGGAAENYGWDRYEGRVGSGCASNGLQGTGPLVWPVTVYSHSLGCSITGGFAYRGRQLPSSLRGSYFFADYCQGTIWRIRVNANGRLVTRRRLVLGTPHNISSFGQGASGELFIATGGGEIYRLAR